MKRSEMIIKLSRYYAQYQVMVEGGYMTQDEFMDNVLTLVEELGMLPPEYWNENKGGFVGSSMGIFENEWEKE